MKLQALEMPGYVAALVRTPLARMGLEPSEVTDDMIMCQLDYESGAVVTIIVMCTTERGWFNRIRPVVSLSFVELDENTRAVKVHFNETMPVPTGPDDLQFYLRFGAKIKAIAYTLAITGNLGKCDSLPRR